MACSPERLTDLQQRVLASFFSKERGFFLTGGAALAGFHLGHRGTDDLDLFTVDDGAFARGRSVLAAVAREVGDVLHVKQDAPGFVRAVLERGGDSLVSRPTPCAPGTTNWCAGFAAWRTPVDPLEVEERRRWHGGRTAPCCSVTSRPR